MTANKKGGVQKRIATCSHSVKNAPGTGYLFSHELTREIAARTSMDLVTVNYIMDTYREVIFDSINIGKKVELGGIGTITFKKRKSFFCRLVARTIPERYYPRLIFKSSLRDRVRQHITADMLNE